jgi:hypothetical protein
VARCQARNAYSENGRVTPELRDARAIDEYEEGLVHRFARLIVADFRRRQCAAPDADAQRRVQPQQQPREPQGELPPAA